MYALVRFKKFSLDSRVSQLQIFCIFYIAFFSLVGHKEGRFLLPVLPFAFLLMGNLVVQKGFNFGFTKKFLWLSIIVELIVFIIRGNFVDQFNDIPQYLNLVTDYNVDSVFSIHRYESPFQSYFHKKGSDGRNRTEIHVVNQAPQFANKDFGTCLIQSNPDYTSYYI